MTEAKRHYARQFGLPSEQIRYFDELTSDQVEEVSRQFSARLIDVEGYVYAVKRDGGLVPRRIRRDPLVERAGQ